MRVVVAAAGSQAKWGGHLGVRSHFAPVRARLGGEEREPLLARTLRQLSATGADVWVTAPAEDPGPYRAVAGGCGVRVLVAEGRNEFVASRPAWAESGRTVLLLGDVWFTDEALATILDCPDTDVRFFGREHASHLTGSRWGEIFATSWDAGQAAGLAAMVEAVGREQDAGRADRAAGWALLRMVQGTPLQTHLVHAPWWVRIDDATDDIDFPEDFERHPATRGAA